MLLLFSYIVKPLYNDMSGLIRKNLKNIVISNYTDIYMSSHIVMGMQNFISISSF
jgi:hypothetical protein